MKEKSIHQLKKEVLVAYLCQQTPGISIERKKREMERYEISRKELEKRIASEYM